MGQHQSIGHLCSNALTCLVQKHSQHTSWPITMCLAHVAVRLFAFEKIAFAKSHGNSQQPQLAGSCSAIASLKDWRKHAHSVKLVKQRLKT